MRTVILTYLLLTLAACAVTQVGEKATGPLDAPAEPVAEAALPTIAPKTVSTIQPLPLKPTDTPLSPSLVAPTETPSPSPVTPTETPSLASAVRLAVWDEEDQPYQVRLVDPATGSPVAGYTPVTLGSMKPTVHALSAGGQKLAVVESRGTSCESYAGGTACRASADMLHLVDIPARREVTANLPGTGWVWLLAFSPDATRLTLVQNERESSTVVVYDTDTGELVAQQVLDFRPSLLAYARLHTEHSQSDGMALVIYGQPLGSPPGMGQPGSPRVLLADGTTLEILWDQPLENIVSGYWCLEKCEEPHGEQLFAEWNPAVIHSLDGQRLYIVHANTEWLTTVDFNTRSVSSVEIQAVQSWFERLLALTAGVVEAKGGVTGATKEAMLSPDGKQLYIVTTAVNSTRDANDNWDSLETHLDLQVLDVDSGRKITGHDVEVTGTWISADKVQFTPDGAHILIGGWSDGQRWAQVLDAESLEPVVRLIGWEVTLTQRLDGQPVILGSKYHNGRRVEFALLDSRSFDIAGSWTVSINASWLAP